jgi:multicomponent Na+:H+ antiporter subunit B
VSRSRVRGLLALPLAAGLLALLVWGFVGLPSFGDYKGPYGYVINRLATPQRHTTNAVSAVVFDYRGFDTMGEEFILFGAVMGVVLLLRSREEGSGEEEEEDEGVVDPVSSDVLRTVGILATGLAFLVGVWLIAFGFVTPGGGFQGGVVVAGAFLLVYVTGSYASWKKVSSETAVDPAEGFGVGAYVALGVATLAAGAPFLHNFLGPGKSGTLQSGGSLSFLNWATAIEVAAANIVLCSQFLREYVAPLASRGESR